MMKSYLSEFESGIIQIVLAPIPPKYVCRDTELDILYGARMFDCDIKEIRIFLVNQKLHDQIQNLFAIMWSSSEDPVDRIEELFDQTVLIIETEDILHSGLFSHNCHLSFDTIPPKFSEEELLLAIDRIDYLERVLTRNKECGT